MSTHYQETQNEPEAQPYGRVPDPVSVALKEEVSAPQFATETEILQAFQKIKARDSERLLQMDFEEVHTLLRAESRKRTQRQWIIGGTLGTFFLLDLLFTLLKYHTGVFHYMSYFVGVMVAAALVASRKHRSAALAISRFDNVRAIGPLAETLDLKDKSVLSIATQSLICLLPRLKASDAALLNPNQRAALNRALRGKNTDLTLAILKAWEQVGDAGAIPEVEYLAQGGGYGGQYLTVMTVARECLPFLRQSAERQQFSAQLLRPADGNVTPSDVLLRPAMPHAPTEPSDQLLRPTDEA